jgi:hypothetical protein
LRGDNDNRFGEAREFGLDEEPRREIAELAWDPRPSVMNTRLGIALSRPSVHSALSSEEADSLDEWQLQFTLVLI